jgi:hypothetical protein
MVDSLHHGELSGGFQSHLLVGGDDHFQCYMLAITSTYGPVDYTEAASSNRLQHFVSIIHGATSILSDIDRVRRHIFVEFRRSEF